MVRRPVVLLAAAIAALVPSGPAAADDSRFPVNLVADDARGTVHVMPNADLGVAYYCVCGPAVHMSTAGEYWGLPIRGRLVHFSIDGEVFCEATTNSNGQAFCATDPELDLRLMQAGGYLATFAGDDAYHPARARGYVATVRWG